jgi:hypothetical protein
MLRISWVVVEESEGGFSNKFSMETIPIGISPSLFVWSNQFMRVTSLDSYENFLAVYNLTSNNWVSYMI